MVVGRRAAPCDGQCTGSTNRRSMCVGQQGFIDNGARRMTPVRAVSGQEGTCSGLRLSLENALVRVRIALCWKQAQSVDARSAWNDALVDVAKLCSIVIGMSLWRDPVYGWDMID